jgi:tyrosyl-tRNA synthetase
MQSSVLEELEWRGFLHQITDEGVDELLAEQEVTLYCGFDPTAESLQVGNLLALMMLALFRRHGHEPLALVGGATGLIGDPSGKSEERNLLDDEELQQNIEGISDQIDRVLGRAAEMHPETLGADEESVGEGNVPLLNNADWMRDKTYIEFLRDVGKYFRVNQMTAKESVRARLEEREQGISYTEFSYMVLQAYDFLHLHEQEDCRLQVGGSDQWGNITAGTDLVRRKLGDEVFGITAPLITSASGEKLGKTGDKTIWLDPDRTSPYEFYQYWVRRRDEDVPQLLRMFTFLPREEVQEMVGKIERDENRGEVQEKLAWEVTALVHGPDEADFAVKASDVLFGEPIEGMSDEELEQIFADVPSTTIDRDDLEGEGIEIRDLFVETELQSSRGDAKRLIRQGGAYLNNEKVEDLRYMVTADDLASQTMLVVRSGKKNYHLVRTE